MKNALKSTGNKADHMEEKISELYENYPTLLGRAILE